MLLKTNLMRYRSSSVAKMVINAVESLISAIMGCMVTLLDDYDDEGEDPNDDTA